MNKRLLLFIFVSICSFLNAQSVSVEPNPANATADLDDLLTHPEEMVAQAFLSNNTSDTLFMKWERILENTPEGWKTSVADFEIHVFPLVNARDFVLPPNASEALLSVHAYPGGQPCCLEETGALPGEGEVHLKVTNLNDPADTLIAVYLFTLTGNPILDLSELELEQIKIFPNPASDYFTLTGTKETQCLIIYNILGNQVKSFDVNSNRQFEISDLPNGTYFIELINSDQKSIKSFRLLKQ